MQNRSSDLYVTGGHVHIPAFGRSLYDGPDYAHDILGTEFVGQSQRRRLRPIRAEGNLDEPTPVPEVQEDQSSQISPAVHPTGQPQLDALLVGTNPTHHPGAKRRTLDIDQINQLCDVSCGGAPRLREKIAHVAGK
jgi:hypothetical protein